MIDNKKVLRKTIYAKRTSIVKDTIENASRRICENIMKLHIYHTSDILLIYMPFRNEVKLDGILQDPSFEEKKIYIPRVNGDEMQFFLYDDETEFETSSYGIKEPLPKRPYIYEPGQKVLMLIPGVAYDNNRNRLGYGGGYYDRYLADKDIPSIAPAYDIQISGEPIDAEEHDIKPDMIVTEKKIIL